MGAVVAKWSGHRAGNRKVPVSMPGIDPWLLLCFLGQETYPSPSHPAVKPGTYIVCMYQGMAEEQPIWLMPSSL